MSKEEKWMREQAKWMREQLRRLENAAEYRRAEILRRQKAERLAVERARDEGEYKETT